MVWRLMVRIGDVAEGIDGNMGLPVIGCLWPNVFLHGLQFYVAQKEH
jgi:hypothetical protein